MLSDLASISFDDSKFLGFDSVKCLWNSIVGSEL